MPKTQESNIALLFELLWVVCSVFCFSFFTPKRIYLKQHLKMPASDKVKETVRKEAEAVGALASEAARSGAYLYPLKVQSI